MSEPLSLLNDPFSFARVAFGEEEDEEEEDRQEARQAATSQETPGEAEPAPVLADPFSFARLALAEEELKPGLIEQIETGALTPEQASPRLEQAGAQIDPVVTAARAAAQQPPQEPSLATEAARAPGRLVGGLRRVAGSAAETAGGAAAALGGVLSDENVPVALQAPGRILQEAGQVVEEMGGRAQEQERLEEKYERPLQPGQTGELFSDLADAPLVTLARDVPGVFGSLAGSILVGGAAGPGLAGPVLGVSEQYSRAREEGQPRGKAFVEAGTAGMAMGALESLSLSKILGVRNAKWAIERIQRIGEGALTEGTTEAAQALVSDAGSMIRQIAQGEARVGDLRRLLSAENIRQYLAEGVLGMIAGGAAGVLMPSSKADRETLINEFGAIEIAAPPEVERPPEVPPAPPPPAPQPPVPQPVPEQTPPAPEEIPPPEGPAPKRRQRAPKPPPEEMRVIPEPEAPPAPAPPAPQEAPAPAPPGPEEAPAPPAPEVPAWAQSIREITGFDPAQADFARQISESPSLVLTPDPESGGYIAGWRTDPTRPADVQYFPAIRIRGTPEESQTAIRDRLRTGLDQQFAPAPAAPELEAPTAEKSPAAPRETIRVAESGREASVVAPGIPDVAVRYAVVELESLLPSHTDTLQRNPSYPQEIQPRKRERKAYAEQIDRIARQLDPRQLGENIHASDGAPIVGPDGVVESGNGRVLALRRAYAQHPERAVDYRTWLEENAASFGLSPETARGLSAPVLVRIREGEVDREAFARAANQGSVERMGAVEQAQADAEAMPEGILDLLQPGERGELNTSGNVRFLRDFFGAVSPGGFNAVTTEEGMVSNEGLRRAEAAILTRAYSAPGLVEAVFEDPESSIRRIGSGLLAAAARYAGLRNRIEAGSLHPLDIASDIEAAVKKLTALRAAGQKVEEYLPQQAMFGEDLSQEARELLRVLGTGGKGAIGSSARRINLFTQRYMDLVEGAGNPTQGALFGEVEKPPSKLDLIRRAEQEYERGGVQEQLFDEGGPARAQMPGTKPPRRRRRRVSEARLPDSADDLLDSERAGQLRAYERNLLAHAAEEMGPVAAPQGKPKPHLEKRSQTSAGRRLLARIKRDARGRRIGPGHVAKMLNEAVEAEVRIGRYGTSRRNPAHYNPAGHLIRTRYPHSLALAAHEAGHALQYKLEAEGRLDEELLKPVYESLAELARFEFSSDHGSIQEGVAELVRLVVMQPERLTPAHMRAFDAITQNASELKAATLDASRIWHEHRKRDSNAQWRSIGKGTGRRTKAPRRDRFFGGISRIHGSQALQDEFVRAVRKAKGTWSESKKIVNALFGRTEGTGKDPREVYMFTNRVKSEAIRALEGGGEREAGKRGMRAYVYRELHNESLVEWFEEEFDVEIPESGFVYLEGRAPGEVLADMSAEETEDFSAYGQKKASLARAVKGHHYPGSETAELDVDALRRDLAEQDRAHPEWSKRFDEIEDYFRRLLGLTVLSGERMPDDFERMTTAYRHYWPLMKDAEDDALAARGLAQQPVDTSFGSGPMRSHGGSLAPLRPLENQLIDRTYRVLKSFYWIQAIESMTSFVREVESDVSIPLEARRAVRRMMMPVYEELKPAAEITAKEALAIAKRIINKVNYNTYVEATGDTEAKQQAVTKMDPEKFLELTGQKKVERTEELDTMFAGAGLWRSVSPGKALHQVIQLPRGKRTAYYQIGPMAPHLWSVIATSESKAGATARIRGFGGLMRPFSNAFRRTATGSLVFAIGSNALRDVLTGFILGRSKLPGHNFAIGMLETLTGRVPADLSMPEHVGFYADDLNHPAHRTMVQNFWEDLRRDSVFDRPMADGWAKIPAKTMATLFIKPWEVLQILTFQPQISLAIERFSRIGEAAIAARRGADAGTQLRVRDEVTGSFGEMAGNETLRAILGTIPFGNAGTVVNYQLVRRLFLNPRVDERIETWARLGGTVMFTASLWALSRLLTNDDDEEALTEMPEETRAIFFPLFGKFLIPFNYGIDGALQSSVVAILDETTKDLPPTDRRKLAGRIVSRAGDLPNPWTNMQPILNAMAGQALNRRLFWGNEIEPWWMQSWAAIDRKYSTTPGFYAWAARSLQNLPGGKDVSPLEVQAFMETAGGPSTSDWMKLFDMLARGESMKEALLSPRNPLFSRRLIEQGEFTGRRSISIQRMSDMEKLRSILRKRYEQIVAEGREGSPQGREADRWIRELNHPDGPHEVWKQISKLQREESDLVKSDPTVNRRAILLLRAKQTRLAREWLERHRPFTHRAMKALREYD